MKRFFLTTILIVVLVFAFLPVQAAVRLNQADTYYPSYYQTNTAITSVSYSICRLDNGDSTQGFWYDFVAVAFQDAYDGDSISAMTAASGTVDSHMTYYGTGWAIPNVEASYQIMYTITDGTTTKVEPGPLVVVNDTGDQAQVTAALNTYDPPTDTEMIARTLATADYFDPANDTVVNVTTTASVTNGVTLAADAITASTYDESSAFPLAYADAGNDKIARTGADSDTLETLSDQIDGISGTTNPGLLLDTTVATVTDQTHLILAAGSDVDDSYNDRTVAIYDVTNSDYPSIRRIVDYTGSTKTIELASAADFTVAAADKSKIFVDSELTGSDVTTSVWDVSGATLSTVGSIGKALYDSLSWMGF